MSTTETAEPGTTSSPAIPRHATAILAIICISYFMVILDNSIIFTGLPRIETAMRFSPTGLTWVQDAYTLVFGGLLLLGSRAGDIVGRRRMFFVGLVLFGAASFLVGAAPYAWWLIAARALQGVGAAILAPSSLLSAVLASRRLGAERIILMGRHTTRTDLGREWGATDVVAERGDEGVAEVLDLTGGDGTHVVIEAVGHRPAYDTAVGVVRVGGTISRVGVPQYEDAPVGFGSLFGRNITLTGGPAPVRAYLEELLPEILDGHLDPGKVFDRTVDLDGVPDGYRAMDERTSLKVLVRP